MKKGGPVIVETKVIGIVGSPREKGHTSVIVREAMKGAERVPNVTTEILHLADYEIHPCRACSNSKGQLICGNMKECPCKDDMNRILYEKLVNADGMVIGSPVYFGTMTGQLKSFLDRTAWLKMRKFWALRDKVGGAVTIAFGRHGGQEITLMAINAFFFIHGMIIVGDRCPVKRDYDEYGSMTSDTPYINASIVRGKAHFAGAWADSPYGLVEKDKQGLINAQGVGEHVAEVSKWVKENRPKIQRINYYTGKDID
jgi:multimeric flavodoxin WrbA